jgi:DNA-binding PadR family transcriptional regulator
MGGSDGTHELRSGRKLGAADLQLLLLALLAEQPRHGYELIKAIEAHSKGFYVPSPGVIYPSLKYLDEVGYVVAEADGPRKHCVITDPGRAYLEANRAQADALLAQLAAVGVRMESARRAFIATDTPPSMPSEERNERGFIAELEDARRAIKRALAALEGAPETDQRRAAGLLRKTVDALRDVLDKED